MKVIALINPTGLVGNTLYTALRDDYEFVLLYRVWDSLARLHELYRGLEDHRTVQWDYAALAASYLQGLPAGYDTSPEIARLWNEIGTVDAVVNCASISAERSLEKPIETFFINTLWPYLLSLQFGEKLIHLTTDRVFNGVTGAPYTERSPKISNSFFGLTRAAGELSERSLVLRSAFFGPNPLQGTGVVEYVRRAAGQTIAGYTNQLSNGISTRELARVCDTLLRHRADYPSHGTFHLFSTPVSHYELVQLLAKHYAIDCQIEPTEAAAATDYRLGSEFDFCQRFAFPNVADMVADLE